ncbi:hypothetical protein [Candidatus Regiella insecticola]|uniref:hypothetical protein n=1 Tax=Candidatus Regiella insecticola TaxID=138073 RepID=UPI000305D993|nr:hypothetical protein [Candidatus Regiella insecticola]
MGDISIFLPRLTVNKLFIRDLMAAGSPCFALGYVEERGSHCGVIALRPATPIPSASSAQGFRFGHSVLGFDGKPVLHFAFEFYGHVIYRGLVVPGNPIIQAVINRMLETKDYFFFAINPDQTVIAFRSQLESANLAGLKTNQKQFENMSCTPEQYEKAVKIFTKKPDPPGLVMKWVCRNDWDYLDLTKYRLELNPRQ